MSGGGAGGKGAAAPVPAGSRKLVQGLKEIVNLTEAEIYAAPRECSMGAAASSPKVRARLALSSAHSPLPRFRACLAVRCRARC